MEEDKSKSTKPKRTKKSKFKGVVIRELRTGGKTYKVDATYYTTDKGSLEYLIKAGYLAGTKQ